MFKLKNVIIGQSSTQKIMKLAILALLFLLLSACGSNANQHEETIGDPPAVPPIDRDVEEITESPSESNTPIIPGDENEEESELGGETELPSEPNLNEVTRLDYYTLPVNGIGEGGFSWFIPPTFEYDEIRYCSNCYMLSETDISNADDVAGVLNESYYNNIVYLCWGHGGGWVEYYYDADKETFALFGFSESGSYFTLYTHEEFAEREYHAYSPFRETIITKGLYPIRQINLDNVAVTKYHNDDEEMQVYSLFDVDVQNSGGFDYDTSDAFLGKHALVHDAVFLTDFIYDAASNFVRVSHPEILILGLDGKWGGLDKNADAVIPFVFEHIEFIGDFAALAKYNGKYGILDLRGIGEN
jgi:hypothetical protein